MAFYHLLFTCLLVVLTSVNAIRAPIAILDDGRGGPRKVPCTPTFYDNAPCNYVRQNCRITRDPRKCREERERTKPTPKPATTTTSGLAKRKRVLQKALTAAGLPKIGSRPGWQCAHSTGKGPGCFWTTAGYTINIYNKCAQCAKAFINGEETNSEVIAPVHDNNLEMNGNFKKCPECVKAIVSLPKCDRKILGIGSKRKGKGCKLIKAKGCWHKESDRVIHACREDQHCRFKVTGAKAKIWCCRNKRRCRGKGSSKAKDRNGAIVVWRD